MSPVDPPRTHPFVFPFPPDINPPTNKDRNDMMVTNNVMELSVNSVNRSSKENNKLATIAMTNMVVVPYRTAPPIFFASMMVLSLLTI